jgi:hypothetical protein
MDRELALKYGAFLAGPLPAGYRLAAPAAPAGFVAEKIDGPAEVVIALPGRTSLAWYDDLHVALVPVGGGPGRIGYGYLRSYHALRGAALHELVARHFNGVPLTVVGHGIGAALATVMIFDAALNGGPKAGAAYLFGSPRVGNEAFVAAYTALGVPTWRIANSRDLAQRIPAADYGYAHVGELVRVDSAGVALLDHAGTHAMNTYLHLLDPSVALDARAAPGDIDREMATLLKSS